MIKKSDMKRKFYTSCNVEPTADLIHPVWAMEAAETRGNPSASQPPSFIPTPLCTYLPSRCPVSQFLLLWASSFPSAWSSSLMFHIASPHSSFPVASSNRLPFEAIGA